MKQIIIISMFMLQGCTQYHMVASRALYQKQELNQCGPYALSVLIAHAGINIDPSVIGQEIYDPIKGSTSSLDMLLYTQQIGIDAVLSEMTRAELFILLRADHPVLVALSNEDNAPVHFVVVYDTYGPDVVMNDGYIHDHIMPIGLFMERWKGAGNMTLWVEDDTFNSSEL